MAEEAKEPENEESVDSGDLTWGEPEDSGKKQSVEPPKSASKEPNRNLSTDQMKKLLKKYRDENPDYEVHPVIIKLVPLGANRFYIMRILNTSDMSDVEKMFNILFEEAIEKARISAENEYAEKYGYSEDNPVPEEKRDELDTYILEEINRKREGIFQTANDASLNAIGVLFPENHKEKVMGGSVPPGDQKVIAHSIAVASGFSSVEADIDVYQDNLEREAHELQGFDEASLEDEDEQ